MKRTYIGEFEEIILLTVVYLQEQAYGVIITYEICSQTNRTVLLNQVQVAISCLEEKGMVKSYLGEATLKRGGRRKRLFFITNQGEYALLEIQIMRSNLWNRLLEPLRLRLSI